jgi:hypothetical protein
MLPRAASSSGPVQTFVSALSPLALCTAGLLGLAVPAQAHIDLQGALLGRGGDQKAGPCEGRPRGTPYRFEPGATITVGVNETLAHDGYFRIAFDDDGEDGFVDPASIDPINPNRAGGMKCQGTPEDHCGESDFCNVLSTTGGATVLWDNLDPHIPASILASKAWSWTIKLPDVECSNCTLQVMQVMQDIPGHGPFDGVSDLYYRCIDIELVRGAGNTPGTTTAPAVNNGIDCTKAEVTDAGVVLPDAGVVAGSGGGAAGTDGTVVGGTSGSAVGGSGGGGEHAHAGSGAGEAGSAPVTGAPGAQSEGDDAGGCSVALGRSASGHCAGWVSVLALCALGLRVGRRRR